VRAADEEREDRLKSGVWWHTSRASDGYAQAEGLGEIDAHRHCLGVTDTPELSGPARSGDAHRRCRSAAFSLSLSSAACHRSAQSGAGFEPGGEIGAGRTRACSSSSNVLVFPW